MAWLRLSRLKNFEEPDVHAIIKSVVSTVPTLLKKEHLMNIGEVLSRSWKITWKYKVLWIFGILAGCASGGGSGGSGNGLSYTYDRGDLPPWWNSGRPFHINIPDWQVALIVIMALLFVLLLIALFIFLGTIGKVGLIRGAQQADGDAEKITFGELFSGSMHYFWRVFGLNLLVGVLIFVALIALVLVGIISAAVTLGLALICLIPLACVLVPVMWFIWVIVEQASIAIVVENLGILDGLRRGWEVVRLNLGAMIVMDLLLVLGVGLLGGSDRGLWGGLAVAGLCCAAYLPFLIVLRGILSTYIGTAWTLTYLRLAGQPPALAVSLVEEVPPAEPIPDPLG
jgi:ABC-type multidrug transport system fused ATPase/permease subunit